MDKKNTMLLTVIAVATLLVAVVGATFAYYSVTSNNTSSTRTVTTTTPEVGSVALTSTGVDLYVHLTGDQMADTATAKRTYYHQESDIAAATTATPSAVAKFKVTGSDNDTTYSCLFDYAIWTDGTMTQVKDGEDNLVLKAADAGITLSIPNGTSASFTGLPTTRQATTTTVGTASTTTVKGTAQFQVTGNVDVDVMAVAEFNTENPQNDLAEKSMVTHVDFSNLRCLTGSTYPAA